MWPEPVLAVLRNRAFHLRKFLKTTLNEVKNCVKYNPYMLAKAISSSFTIAESSINFSGVLFKSYFCCVSLILIIESVKVALLFFFVSFLWFLFAVKEVGFFFPFFFFLFSFFFYCCRYVELCANCFWFCSFQAIGVMELKCE